MAVSNQEILDAIGEQKVQHAELQGEIKAVAKDTERHAKHLDKLWERTETHGIDITRIDIEQKQTRKDLDVPAEPENAQGKIRKLGTRHAPGAIAGVPF